MRLMRSFSEIYNDSFETNFKAELKDFCETQLVYLLDKDNYMTIYITRQHDFECDKHRRCTCPFEINLDFSLTDSWDDIKDIIIPFITHLSNAYTILGKIRVQYAIKSFFYLLQDIISDSANITILNNIFIKIECPQQEYHQRHIHESLQSFNKFLIKIDELRDLCDGYLAYLYDEGLELDFSIVKYKEMDVLECRFINNRPFKWNQLKDSFIPLINILSSRYKLYNYNRVDARIPKQICFELVVFRTTKDFFYTIEEINDDNFTAEDRGIFTITIKLGENE